MAIKRLLSSFRVTSYFPHNHAQQRDFLLPNILNRNLRIAFDSFCWKPDYLWNNHCGHGDVIHWWGKPGILYTRTGSRVSNTGIICTESGGGVYIQRKTAFTYQQKGEWILGKEKQQVTLHILWIHINFVPLLTNRQYLYRCPPIPFPQPTMEISHNPLVQWAQHVFQNPAQDSAPGSWYKLTAVSMKDETIFSLQVIFRWTVKPCYSFLIHSSWLFLNFITWCFYS